MTGERTSQSEKVALSIEMALSRVRTALSETRYGEVIIGVEGGRVIGVHKYDRG